MTLEADERCPGHQEAHNRFFFVVWSVERGKTVRSQAVNSLIGRLTK